MATQQQQEIQNLDKRCPSCRVVGELHRRVVITENFFGVKTEVNTWNVCVFCRNPKCHLAVKGEVYNWKPYEYDEIVTSKTKKPDIDTVHRDWVNDYPRRQRRAKVRPDGEPSQQAEDDGETILDAESEEVYGMEIAGEEVLL